MSYVKNFEYDVFVSYAHTDDESLLVKDGDRLRGWVDLLLDRVRGQVKVRLGVPDVCFMIDHEFMRSNLPITTQIVDTVRKSALLLLVMSPSYVNSPWCNKEQRIFLDLVRDRIEAGSLFVVRAEPVERGDQPKELRDLEGVQFFTETAPGRSHRLGWHDPYELEFCHRVDSLSQDLAAQLKKMRTGQAIEPPRPSQTVFLAPATDDLEAVETEVRSYLKQARIDVLPTPQSVHPRTDLSSYENAILDELARCCLFVQLLSGTRGRELSFAPGKRAPVLHEELARRAEKRVLQWRPQNLDLATVTDSGHRALLEAAQACGIEEFKRRVVDTVTMTTTTTTTPHGVVALFVNADVPDHGLAQEVSQALKDRDVDCFWKPLEGSPEEIRRSYEDNMQNCDGLVLVYGKTHLDWVQQQLRLARKMSGSRERPLATLAIFEGPPPQKSEVPAAIKNLILLDCRKGLDPDKLNEFVARVHAGG